MDGIYQSIDSYYTDKIKSYGATPKGVDWNSENSQLIRFEQLSQVIKVNNSSVNDIGCGYGKYSEYLEDITCNTQYTGYDLSREMIVNAEILYPNSEFKHITSMKEILESDYSIASGIFSVKMEQKEIEWLAHILDTLHKINNKSIKGFSFNMLTIYSDEEFMRDNLYYADPLFFFDYCKKKLFKKYLPKA